MIIDNNKKKHNLYTIPEIIKKIEVKIERKRDCNKCANICPIERRILNKVIDACKKFKGQREEKKVKNDYEC